MAQATSVAGKIDAVLANFAVINCIPGIKSLFKGLSLIIKPGGNIIALVLTKDPMRIQGTNFKNVLQSVIFRGPQSINMIIKITDKQFIFIQSKKLSKPPKVILSFAATKLFPILILHLYI